MKTPDFMSYDRYKKKKKKTSANGVLIFITTFFVTLLLFTVIAKGLSPDVDVTIGDDSQTDAKETGLGVKKFIDERLRMIQMEDNSAGVSVNDKTSNINDASFEKYSKSLQDNQTEEQSQEISDEPITLPSGKQNKKQSLTQDKIALTPASAPRPNGSELSKPFETPKTSKVLIGHYSTIEQAQVAQEIVVDSGLNVNPFIKKSGDYYTLQAGSYSSKATANAVAAELQRNNFPARVIQE